MMVGVRRAVTGLVVGLVVALGLCPSARAETPTPTPTATASSAASDGDGPDVAPDNSRTVWALGGAGALALVAAGVVFLRRR